VRLTASISTITKEKLQHFVEAHGFERSFVVEQALLYFMASRREPLEELRSGCSSATDQ
jgi:predicted transcriptional regulator